MKLRFLQVEGPKKKKEKKKKQSLSQLAKIKQIKKRNLVIAGIILLVLIGSAGRWISSEIFKDNGPNGGKTEAAQAEQKDTGKETRQKEPAEDNGILTADLENRLATDFIKTLKSGKYVIKYKTTTVYEGQPYEVETTYAVAGSSIALSAGDRATVVRDGKVYMMNHADKTIISWNVNNEKGAPERIDTEGIAYIGSGEESGLTCEEYSTASSSLKLYFKGKELVKMAAQISKEDMVMDIVSVEKKVPASLFEVPADYQITYI